MKVKTKGTFSPAGLQKNPANEICSDAVVALLKDGIPVEETIRNCTDIRKFITVRNVSGGAVRGGELVYEDTYNDETGNLEQGCVGVEGGEYLGKAIRWYYGAGVNGVLRYKKNAHTVPRSEGAVPCMLLPDELPDNVDYKWYVREANDLLMDLGVVERPPVVKIPRKNSKEWKSLVEQGLVAVDLKGKSFWITNSSLTEDEVVID